MRFPGVTVRPLKQMTGDSGFNEVFFDNVRVPVSNVLGEINKGWQTAITTLMNERANLGAGTYVVFKRNLDDLIERIRRTKRGQNPLFRQKLAQAYIELELFRLTNMRSLTRISQT